MMSTYTKNAMANGPMPIAPSYGTPVSTLLWATQESIRLGLEGTKNAMERMEQYDGPVYTNTGGQAPAPQFQPHTGGDQIHQLHQNPPGFEQVPAMPMTPPPFLALEGGQITIVNNYANGRPPEILPFPGEAEDIAKKITLIFDQGRGNGGKFMQALLENFPNEEQLIRLHNLAGQRRIDFRKASVAGTKLHEKYNIRDEQGNVRVVTPHKIISMILDNIEIHFGVKR